MSTHEWCKRYKNTLIYQQDKFKREYGTSLSRYFDPRRWLHSYSLKEPEVRWYGPKSIINNGVLDFWIDVESESKREVIEYKVIFKVRKIGKKSIPIKFEHSCTDTMATGTGSMYLRCKHLYSALHKLDKELDSIPFAKSMFDVPQDLLERYNEIERRKTLAIEKLKLTFEELPTLNKRLALLERLNRRLMYLKKV